MQNIHSCTPLKKEKVVNVTLKCMQCLTLCLSACLCLSLCLASSCSACSCWLCLCSWLLSTCSSPCSRAISSCSWEDSRRRRGESCWPELEQHRDMRSYSLSDFRFRKVSEIETCRVQQRHLTVMWKCSKTFACICSWAQCKSINWKWTWCFASPLICTEMTKQPSNTWQKMIWFIRTTRNLDLLFHSNSHIWKIQ